MAEQLVSIVENVDNLEVETPNGFKPFSFITKTWHDKIIFLSFSDGSEIRGSLHHKIKLQNNDFKRFCDIEIGESLYNNIHVVYKAISNKGDFLYDLIDVEGGHQYITGSTVSHNCEFLSSDALLIQSQRLIELRQQQPIFIDKGFSFWENIRADAAYLVGVDIATGSGRDYSVVEVFEFPSLVQVAELRTNSLNIPDLYDRIKWLLNKLSSHTMNNKRPEVFWTFERNGVGEAIGALYNTDEHPPEYAELINDVPGKLGMQTTNRNKILACLQLKSMVEKIKNGLEIRSEINIFELKNFIASGGSYAAKIGATDDSVSALLLIVRLLKHVSEFDDKARKLLYEYNAEDYDKASLTVGIETSLDESDEAIPFMVL